MGGVVELTAAGMVNDMHRLDSISNNLANVQTPGYKREIFTTTTFADVFARQLESSSDISAGSTSNAVPTETHLDFQQGTTKFTNNKFDVAIEGDGFFEVANDNGRFYTRSGAFSLDSAGRLVTPGGYTVMGSNGPIRITSDSPVINKQGIVTENKEPVGQIKLVKFEDLQHLKRVGGGLYSAADQSPELIPQDKARLRQGYIEVSNVVQMDEMVNLIEVMRHFEASQRLLRNYDEIIGNAIDTLGNF